MESRIISFFCALTLGVAYGVAAPVDGANFYRRMAVISSPSLVDSGLADLVSHELQENGVELVDREKLNELIHEQSLDAALGADGRGKRIELGRLARADALALVNEEGNGTTRRLHLIVAECTQGARLTSAYFPMASLPGTAHLAATQIISTRRRFSTGVKAMIGVPPFIAKNFTYEYHPLQIGYAVLLQDSLSAIPGVAVVELEEAEAIRNELQAVGGKPNGVVPVFVEGEFEVKTPKGKPPEAQFHIVLRTADTPRNVERHGLSLAEASDFVARDLVREILPNNAEPAHAFSADAEFSNLVKRADEFDSLGECRLAANLRQAALVIRPNDEKQRDQLLQDCDLVLTSLRDSPVFRKKTLEWERTAAAALPYYIALLETLEWKIRRNHDHPDGIGASGAAAGDIIWLTSSRAATLAQPYKRDFLLNVYPLTWNPAWNSEQPRLRNDPGQMWFDKLLSIALFANNQTLTADDYGVLLKILNDMAPDHIPPSNRLITLLWGGNPTSLKSRSTPAFQEFLSQLAQSNRPLNRILGEAALSMKVNNRGSRDPRLSDEVESIRRDYLAMELPGSVHVSSGVMDELDSIKAKLSLAAKPPQAGDAVSGNSQSNGEVAVGASNASDRRPPAHADKPPLVIETGALKFENIPFKRRMLSGEVKAASLFGLNEFPGTAQLLRCTDSLDVSWDEDSVNVMREPGMMEELISPPGKRPISDVKWDGEHLWIATTRDGLWVVDTSGRIVAKIGQAEGLPPCDRGVKIEALGRDRLMVVGSFGPSARAFVASLSMEAEGYRVKVIHQAPRVAGSGWQTRDQFDSNLSFVPRQIARCRSKDGDEFLVINRWFSTLGAETHPLIVNLKTLTVASSKTRLSQNPFLAVANGILQPTWNKEEYLLWRPTKDGDDFTSDFPPLCLPHDRSGKQLGAQNPVWAVGQDGQVYLPGSSWFRIDPTTMTACCLAQNGPPAGWYQHIALSHIGLVYWGFVAADENTMYAVHIDDDAAQKLEKILPSRRDDAKAAVPR